MKLRTFNFSVSLGALVLGTVYVLYDQPSITANVIGYSGTNAGVASFVGLGMIVGAIGLFIVSQHSTDHRDIGLEILVRRNKQHEDLSKDTRVYDKIPVEEYKESATEETKI